MTHLFIIESPFQLLSALEASNYFKGEENVFVIKYSSYKTHSNNNEQLLLLKSEIDSGKIYEILPSISTRLTNIKLLILIYKIKKTYKFIDKVFLGEYRSWVQREFVNNLSPKKCYILDDGNVIIALQNDYIPTGKYYYFGNSHLSKISEQLQHFFWSKLLFPFQKEKMFVWNLFTCFDLKANSSKQDIVKHSFQHLRKRGESKPILNYVVFFFGGNLSELEILTREEEIFQIERIKFYFENKNIKLKYIPHRRESKEKLEIIKNQLNIDILIFSLPAEIEFIMMSYVPQFIASFFSTALYTVSRFSCFQKVYSFKLDQKKINKNHRCDISNTYNSYEIDPIISVISIND